MLHSAGIAGLAMTLAQLDRLYPQSHQRPAGLSWLSDEIKIELFWTGDDAIALAWLLSESFRIDGDGLISLTGLVSTDRDISVRVAIHQGITKSFLQHGLCRFPAQSMLLPRSQLMGKMLKLVIKSLLAMHIRISRRICAIDRTSFIRML